MFYFDIADLAHLMKASARETFQGGWFSQNDNGAFRGFRQVFAFFDVEPTCRNWKDLGSPVNHNEPARNPSTVIR